MCSNVNFIYTRFFVIYCLTLFTIKAILFWGKNLNETFHQTNLGPLTWNCHPHLHSLTNSFIDRSLDVLGCYKDSILRIFLGITRNPDQQFSSAAISHEPGVYFSLYIVQFKGKTNKFIALWMREQAWTCWCLSMTPFQALIFKR